MQRYRVPSLNKIKAITSVQIKNLTKLANKLDTVPNSQFEMQTYFESDHIKSYSSPTKLTPADYAPECGTIACACGWGPAAGVRVPKGVTGWNSYGTIAFGADPEDGNNNSVYGYLFDGDRGGTAKAAARRIRKVISIWSR